MPSVDQVYWALQCYIAEASSWDVRRILLERLQPILFTDDADNWLLRVIKADCVSSGPESYIDADIGLVFLMLLRRARSHGVAFAWSELVESGRIVAELYDEVRVIRVLEVQDQIRPRVTRWAATTRWYQARRMLEAHTGVLLHPLSECCLLEQIVAAASTPKEVNRLHNYLYIMRELRTVGPTEEAIRRAYVNAYGGFALEAPRWVRMLETRVRSLTNQQNPEQSVGERIRILRKALAHAARDREVVAEVEAELRTLLADALYDAATHGPEELQEECLRRLYAVQRVYSIERYPRQYARTQGNLAMAYVNRLKGLPSRNLEIALARYQEALLIHTELQYPEQYAGHQIGLGNAYLDRVRGSRSDNIEQAITCYENARSVLYKEAFPDDYSLVMHNLGIAYSRRLIGSKWQNDRRALQCYEKALELRDPTIHPLGYANTQEGMGWLYLGRSRLKRDVEKAISCFEEALRARLTTGRPIEIASAQYNLGCAYLRRGEADDIEKARKHFEEIVRAHDHNANPIYYGSALIGLVSTSSQMDIERQPELKAQMKRWLHEALTIFPLTEYPDAYRDIQLQLASLAIHDLSLVTDADAGFRAARVAHMEEAHRAYMKARRGQAELVWGIGHEEGVAKLRSKRNLYTEDAWYLWRLGRLRDAVVALEAGRAQALAKSELIAEADLSRLCETHRAAYATAREMLRMARSGRDHPAGTEAYERLRALRSAIRTHCDHNFLPAEPRYADVERATRYGDTLVYLMATDAGGVAFVVAPLQELTADEHGGAAMLSAIPLPRLTTRIVDRWLSRSDNTYTLLGGFKYIVYFPPVFCLANWIEAAKDDDERIRRRAMPISDVAAALPLEWDTMRMALNQLVKAWRLRAARSSSGAEAELLRARLAQPLGDALDQRTFHGVLDWFFQRAEVERLLPELGETVMAPLREGLDAAGLLGHEHRIMLIPSGHLGALPLHAAPVLDAISGEQVPFFETCICAYQASAGLYSAAREKCEDVPNAPLFAIAAPKSARATPLRWAAVGAEASVTLAQASGRIASATLLGEHVTHANLVALLNQINKDHIGALVEIATHGHSDPSDPSSCFLSLAHDEEFTLAELQSGRLLQGVRCCIASGCYTAVGDVFEAPDELGSFAAGLLQAGAASAIATQWAVADRATFFYLMRFYWSIFVEGEQNLHRAQRGAAHWLRSASRAQLAEFARQLAGTPDVAVTIKERHFEAVRGTILPDDDWDMSRAIDLNDSSATQTLRTFVNPDENSIKPYAHPVYWAGFVNYGA